MHLNALYREAQAGKACLVECVHALTAARRRDGVVLRPLRYWTVRRARHHFDRARHHLEVVRRHVRGAAQAAAAGAPQVAIDSSGGYSIGGLLGGGMLDQLVTTTIDSTVDGAIDGSLTDVRGLLSEVEQLLLRMRKAGAVG